MSLNINSFQNRINELGLAKANKYEVEISTGSGSIGKIVDQDLTIMCETVSIKGKTLTTDLRRTYGLVRQVAYGINFEDLTLGFICTENLRDKKFFDAWVDYIYPTNAEKNYDVKYYNEYTGTVTVHLLNDNLERVHKIEYKEAYPYQISPLDLGYATNNSYLKLNVAFKYAWWQDTTIT